MDLNSKTSASEKLSYEAPVVIDYGTLQELTRAGHVMNSDNPSGNPANTAYPPS